ncbi:hypothetical protein PR202_gb05216 [Eleusine coracana subsp. coracana]|uniref:NAC domain-containing protein n=1 Tax=Eleusine coracana subsp. coracana TaxID=191504 RepID=A0AAV5E622_ELECO|nr:hypothetical protein QOZ80_1BG0078590 [Eleusine coracana subsp. coracana]GJN18095.1 hypothetical protein PR202_gb05216 [Eleusine coracana subsp. coracana]
MARSTSPPTNDKPPSAPFHSQPSDLELVKSYLRPWVDSGIKAGAFIHVSDVYAADPATLTQTFAPAVAQDGERAWYFLTPLRRKSERGKRKARTVATGEGWWHNEAKSKPVVDGLDGRRHVGYRQSFSFMKKEAGQRTRTGWLMLELRLEAEREEGSHGSLVMCKVYRSPRHPGESTPPTPPAGRKPEAVRDDDESSASPPQPKGKADEGVGSDASRATVDRRKSDGEGSSAATVAAPRKAGDEIPGTAVPGRKEKDADDDDDEDSSAQTSPGSKRKAADDESSAAASAAEPPRSKRKIDGELHCPQCGCHLDAEAVLAAAKSKSETKSETEIVHVDGDPSLKDHSFHQFF